MLLLPVFDLIQIFMTGMVFMFFVYMLVRSIGLKEVHYRNYALYLFWFTTYLSINLAFNVWPEVFVKGSQEIKIAITLKIICQLAAYIVYFKFVSAFLNLPKHLPQLNKVFGYVKYILLIYIGLILINLALIHNNVLRNFSFDIARIILSLLSIYAITMAFKIKEGIVKFFILGNSLYLIFALLSWLISVQSNSPLIHNYPFILVFGDLNMAIILESICFALGLGYKELQCFKEREQLQFQLIQELEKTSLLQKKDTEQLEAQVKERTNTILALQKKQFESETQLRIDEERTRISRDMHDDLGSGLSGIFLLANHLKQNAKTQYPELSSDIDKIVTSSEDLNHRIREIIWTTSSEDDSLASLVSFIDRHCHVLSEKTKTQIKCINETYIPDIKLKDRERKNLFLCTKEFLNNAIKHNHNASIELNIKFPKLDSIKIEIKDNGVGFNYNQIRHKGNGLRNISQRIKDINGTFEIKSNDSGTIGTMSLVFGPPL